MTADRLVRGITKHCRQCGQSKAGQQAAAKNNAPRKASCAVCDKPCEVAAAAKTRKSYCSDRCRHRASNGRGYRPEPIRCAVCKKLIEWPRKRQWLCGDPLCERVGESQREYAKTNDPVGQIAAAAQKIQEVLDE